MKVNSFINYAYSKKLFSKDEIKEFLSKIQAKHRDKNLLKDRMVTHTLRNLIKIDASEIIPSTPSTLRRYLKMPVSKRAPNQSAVASAVATAAQSAVSSAAGPTIVSVVGSDGSATDTASEESSPLQRAPSVQR